MHKLMDRIEWHEGMAVYWFQIYNNPINNDGGFISVMHSDTPLYPMIINDVVHFMFDDSTCYSLYGYYSSYETALIALADALKLAYRDEMKRQMEKMRRIKELANSNKISFAFGDTVHTFTRDEIEILRGFNEPSKGKQK